MSHGPPFVLSALVRLVCLCAAIGALGGCASERAHAPPPSSPPPGEVRGALFSSLPRGWRQFDEGVQRSGRCHVVANTLAANWRPDRAGSHGWAADMPPDAIAITVSLIGPRF